MLGFVISGCSFDNKLVNDPYWFDWVSPECRPPFARWPTVVTRSWLEWVPWLSFPIWIQFPFFWNLNMKMRNERSFCIIEKQKKKCEMRNISMLQMNFVNQPRSFIGLCIWKRSYYNTEMRDMDQVFNLAFREKGAGFAHKHTQRGRHNDYSLTDLVICHVNYSFTVTWIALN